MLTEAINPISTVDTTPIPLSPLDTWIRRHADLIKRLMHTPHGNVLCIREDAAGETNGQRYVRISNKGVSHQFNGQIYRTAEQLEHLLGINVSSPAA